MRISKPNLMSRNIEITIPKPCREDWRKFTPTASGGFCTACQKEVIDFTQWTDESILQFFQKAQGNTCGRFRESQLKSFKSDGQTRVRWPMAVFLTMAALGMNKPTEARVLKQKAPVEQRKSDLIRHIKSDTLMEKIIITGVVMDEDSVALPGVNIIQKGTTNNTVSDGDGKFMLVISRPAYAESLQFSFIGMITAEQQIIATQAAKSVKIIMKPDSKALNEKIIVGGAIAVRRFSPRRLWWRIRGLFSRN